MKNEIFERTELLIGAENVKKLQDKTVAVFGLGGVGGFAVEALARAGIGKLVLVDNDVIVPSNLNRQIFALHSTIGRKKTDVAKARVLDLNPNCVVETHFCFFDENSQSEIDFLELDFVVDAIDSLKSKVLLAKICMEKSVKLISSMSTGNKLNPLEFEVADISQTSVCPIAKILRKELKKVGVENLKVVFSREVPKTAFRDKNAVGKQTVASISFVPSVAGLLLASEVVKELLSPQKGPF